LPGGPVGRPAKWATTSNVEVGQTTYPVDRKGMKEGVEWGGAMQGPLAKKEGLGLYLDTSAGVPCS